MFECTATIDRSAVIAPVPPRLFGSFVEHMGRCVYGGVYEPGSRLSDEDGHRADVLNLVRELGVSLVRYPGGNFLSTYRWEDGVGPHARRPRRLDLAWRSIESNAFGLHEFMQWTRKAGVEPMLAVNLGTRGIAEACDLLEYTNFPGGTRMSDLRIAHGQRQPYGAKLWCLGNELDGPWQIGQKTASEYGRLAAETAKAMRRLDPDIELIACGSSNERMPTFGAWEAEVLEHVYEVVDYISVHAYFDPEGSDRAQYLASSRTMDKIIEDIAAVCDRVAGKRRTRRTVKICFDEWNVWRQSRFPGQNDLLWAEAPRLIEDEYTVEDAVVVGSLLMSLLRHSNRIAAACQAQLVNVIAPIRSEPSAAWRQTIFYPFALTARHARGNVLRVEPSTPRLRLGPPDVELAVTHNPEDGAVAVFAINRHRSEAARLQLRIPIGAMDKLGVEQHLVLGGNGLRTTNSEAQPTRVTPAESKAHGIEDGVLYLDLPPVSWTVCVLGNAASATSRG
jgi:alpha-L-arabinofuranosidase